MWATVSTCTGAVQNYHGMVVLRFFLGFVEAPFFRKFPYPFLNILRIDSFANDIQLVRSTFSARGTPNENSLNASLSSMLLGKWPALLVDFSAQLLWVAWKAKEACPHGGNFPPHSASR
jgi:hypothetical protein